MKYDINNPRPLPDQDKLKRLLDYNPATGALTWIGHKNRTDLNGTECGTLRKDGYITCYIESHKFAAHRVIYKWMTGNDPEIMDHINGKPSDNRWHNLRSVSPQENNFNVGMLKNNKTGIGGVSYRKDHDRYIASVRVNDKSQHLGSFKTKAEAEAARKAANVILGFSDRHGKVA